MERLLTSIQVWLKATSILEEIQGKPSDTINGRHHNRLLKSWYADNRLPVYIMLNSFQALASVSGSTVPPSIIPSQSLEARDLSASQYSRAAKGPEQVGTSDIKVCIHYRATTIMSKNAPLTRDEKYNCAFKDPTSALNHQNQATNPNIQSTNPEDAQSVRPKPVAHGLRLLSLGK